MFYCFTNVKGYVSVVKMFTLVIGDHVITNALNTCFLQNIGLTHVKPLLFFRFPFCKKHYASLEVLNT